MSAVMLGADAASDAAAADAANALGPEEITAGIPNVGDAALVGSASPGTANGALSKAQLSRFVRREVDSHFFDDSGAAAPEGTAIYWLADPRDIQQVRYVGQTSSPRRRFLQHLNTARLWLPDETPWWVQSPKLRPLYEWIRALHRDELRLPVMVVSAWLNSTAQARLAERSRILDCLARRLPLLNVEAELLGKQLPLL